MLVYYKNELNGLILSFLFWQTLDEESSSDVINNEHEPQQCFLVNIYLNMYSNTYFC